MAEIKNKFYLYLDMMNKRNTKYYLAAITKNGEYEGFVGQEGDVKCKIKFYNKIKDVNLNYDDILKESIKLQAKNNEICLSFIAFQNEIEKTQFKDIADKEISFANCIFQKKHILQPWNLKKRLILKV